MSSKNALVTKLSAALARLTSKKRKKIIADVLREMKEKNVPLPGNICHGCGGHVVKNVNSLFRGVIRYSLPECNGCGRIYLYAENAPCVGEEEFMRKLHRTVGCAYGRQ